MSLTAPTILTLLRIALIPVLLLVFYLPYDGSNIAAVSVFILAGITDWLDGWVARRYSLTSQFGAFLDPVADKLMVAVALVIIVQAHSEIVLALSAAVIIGREISISALREWMAELGERGKVKVSWTAKVKTTFQMIAIGFLLYAKPLWGLPILEIGTWLLIAAAALTLWSMLTYMRAAWPTINNS